MPELQSTSGWWLYIIRSGDGSFYTGITTDVQRRLLEHADTALGAKGKGKSKGKSKGAKALRGKSPLQLVYQSPAGNRSTALKFEYKVKQLSRIEKERLVTSQQSLTDFLAVAISDV